MRGSNIFPDLRIQWRRQFKAPHAAFWLIAGLSVFAGTAEAIDPDRAMSQYIHERWGTEQGFPRGPVYAISQSGDGYLWIGTQAGLVRFDGLNFRPVHDSPVLQNNASVFSLTQGRDGSLWVRLDRSTVLRYRNGIFDPPAAEDEFQHSWITTMSRSDRGEPMVSLMNGDVVEYHGNRFEMVADGSSLPRSPVLAVARTRNGDMWAGTRDGGLFRFSHGKITSVTDGLPDPKVNCLLADPDGTLWVGTDDGVARWNGTRLTTAGIPDSVRHLQVLTLLRDRDANIWVGTDSAGLLRLNERGASSLDNASLDNGEGRAHEAITAVFEDREGSLWIGSDSGLERLRDSAFLTYSAPEGLPTDGSNPVFVDAENRLWFPPIGGGLWWAKDGQHGSVSAGGLDKDVVYTIAGKSGELWIGRQHGGLTELRSDGGAFTAQSWTEANGLAQNSVYSVYLARDGTVWAGTLSAGVSALHPGSNRQGGGIFTNYTTTDGLASNMVVSMLEGSDGTMWFATPNGLSAFSKGHWQSYAVKNGLPSENVNCMLEDSAGVLWVGTASGLSFRTQAGFQVPKGIPAALHEQVLGLAEDAYGWLWIATSNHVLRVNRDRLLRGVLAEGDVREYGLADGLRGLEGVKRHQSVFKDAAGKIWFSLNRGISVVDPARQARNPALAIPRVQTISADGNAIPLRANVRIPGGYHRVTFGFSGLILSVPDRVRYRYMLDQFDHGWSEPSALREAVYTNLPPGSYRFRLLASNADGVWSGTEAAIGLEVSPLFWQAMWFRICCVASIVVAGLALYRLRLHALTAQLHARFEERLSERTRIAQELHDTLLQGFFSASMLVHVANDALAEDSKVKPTLTRALELMGHEIEEGRNAVRGLRASRGASLDLEQAFSLIQQEVVSRETAPVEFRVIVDGEQRPLHPLLRDEVYRIGREALTNALRHSRAKKIEIELSYSSRHLRVLVRDDGCGIDPQVLQSGSDGHWGLSGMRERAERIGARFHVWSSAAAGTEIELSVPGNIAFEDHRKHMFGWFGKRFLRNGGHHPTDNRAADNVAPDNKNGTIQ